MAKRVSPPRRAPRAAAETDGRTSGTRRAAASRAGQDPGETDAPADWRTGITLIEPNRILVRGYRLDDLMGRLSFAEAVYLLLSGELPSPAVGRLMDALLVSSIDHGATPPSTLAARNVATTGAPIRAAAAAGVLAFGSSLGGGGGIEACLRFLTDGLDLVGDWVSPDDAARRLVNRALEDGAPPPGFGHRFHTRDPRAARLLQLALELELDSAHVQLIRSIERVLAERHRDRRRSAAAHQRGGGHRGHLRRPGLRCRDGERPVHDLAPAGHRRTRHRGSRNTSRRCASSTRPATATTDPTNAACRRRAGSSPSGPTAPSAR